jgi:hypothetical protein
MPSHIVSFSDSACAGGAASVAIAADMVTAIEAPLKHIMSLHNWTLWTGYLTFADARLPTALPLPFTPGDCGVPRWLLASKTTIDFGGKQARGWRQEWHIAKFCGMAKVGRDRGTTEMAGPIALTYRDD